MPRAAAAALIALLATAGLLVLRGTGALQRLELLTHDARILSGMGRRAAGDDIVVAWIDQDAMDYMRGRGVPFPWPRSLYANVLDYLVTGGAKAVVFDVLFTEPGLVAADDAEFGAALARAPRDVLACKFVAYRDGGFDAEETAQMAARGITGLSVPGARAERGFALPIPELAAPSAALGFVNIAADADKVYRGYDLLRHWNGKAYPALALAAALLATAPEQASTEGLAFDGQRLRVAGRDIPVNHAAHMQLAFRGPPLTFAHVQFVNIFESMLATSANETPIYPAERFKDKVVLVGINAEGYADVVPTPLSKDFPGVELHATALDNLLRGDALRPIGGELLLGAGAALLATVLVFVLPGTLWPALALAGLLLAIVVSSFALFARGAVLPTAAPAVGVLLAGGGAFLWRLTFEGKKRREMKRAFTSYLAPEVVAEVLKDPDRVKLGGETREVTLLFTDLAGFTALAEHLDAQQLVAFLNDYFTRMCDRVLEQRGVIDKFIGDAIMAMFGAPLPEPAHSARAVRAALAMLAEMDHINAELTAKGKPAVVTRIGIHAGAAVVGNMGSNKRFDYTAIGDTVNLASRLEGANKAFGTLCLVSEAAWQQGGAGVFGREVGLVRVKGRAQPIRVFEPLATQAPVGAAAEFSSRYDAALRALRAGRSGEASRAFQDLRRDRPHDVLVGLYADQLSSPSWDGVFTLDAK
jgi:adenylate cyclase